ncbi:MAG TPA: recombination mediator RecR [Candidatus Edwardsbacteria bacterium]|nr:recombination mediator RecR [Candidatus Edwardsbacteria bacterium]
MNYGSEILSRTVDELMKLPGIGRKTAQRLAFYLLKIPKEDAQALATAIIELKDKVRFCARCFNASERELCSICANGGRDTATLCVVEETNDLLAIEKTAEFKGVYHVLQGHLSPLDGIGPDDLRIQELMQRLEKVEVREMIMATNPNAEGEATALYLMKLVKPLGIKVTRIARGLPVGSDLEFSDEVTLGRALAGRQEM